MDKSKNKIKMKLPRPHLTTSYKAPNNRRDKQPNPYNILSAPMDKKRLVETRKNIKADNKNKPKKSKPAPMNNNINYCNINKIVTQMSTADMTNGIADGYICCDDDIKFQRDAEKCKNNFAIECVVCLEYYHWSCLKNKYGLNRDVIDMLKYMYSAKQLKNYPFKCLECKNKSRNNNIKSPTKDTEMDIDMCNAENTNTPRRRSARLANK
eukprot:494244_1